MTIDEATQAVNDSLSHLKRIREINFRALQRNDSWEIRDVATSVETKALEKLREETSGLSGTTTQNWQPTQSHCL